MKKLVLLFTILQFTFTTCSSKQPDSAFVSNNLLLYEISGNGLSAPSYIFGTLHLIPSDQFSIPEVLVEKLEGVDALVLETNIDIPLKEQIAIIPRMLLPSEQTLADYLSEEDYTASISYLTDSLGLSEKKAGRYMRFKPIYLMAPILAECYDKPESYEVNITKMAKKKDKDLLFLEELEFQLNLLDSIPMDVQVKDFSIQAMVNDYKEMLDIYLQQDLDKLEEFIISQEDYEVLEKDIMVKRNRNWLPQLDKMMKEQSVMTLVGAGHLIGNNGILNLLKEQGYNIKQVEPKLAMVE